MCDVARHDGVVSDVLDTLRLTAGGLCTESSPVFGYLLYVNSQNRVRSWLWRLIEGVHRLYNFL